MTKILGGRYRNIRVINGKTCIKVQAVVPMPKDLKKAEKVCGIFEKPGGCRSVDKSVG